MCSDQPGQGSQPVPVEQVQYLSQVPKKRGDCNCNLLSATQGQREAPDEMQARLRIALTKTVENTNGQRVFDICCPWRVGMDLYQHRTLSPEYSGCSHLSTAIETSLCLDVFF